MFRGRDERTKRQQALLRLLSGRAFSRQSEVAEAMRRLGFSVTQSSISRDLRELGVAKVGGRYVSLHRSEVEDPSPPALIHSVEPAGPNLIVIKTPIGAANIVGVDIDNRGLDGLVGSVAGDDTVFLAVRNKKAQDRVLSALRRLM